MSATEPIWITEADVTEMMHLGEAIDALEAGLILEAGGGATNMVKTHVLWDGGHTLHAIGATAPGAGFVATKTWAHTGGGATPLLILWDSETGNLKATIEAFALGQMRTGSMSGVATRWMSDPAADELAIIGTGKQAITQVAAVANVRNLKRVRIFSPTPENRQAFAARLNDAGFGFECEVADSVEDCVAGAPVVTIVTRAREPFVNAGMLAPGAHLNAVGAISPEREEFAQDIFSLADPIACDSVPAIQKLSREFMTYFDDGPGKGAPGNWNAVRPISEIVAAGQGRTGACRLSLFKAMGMGISDLSLGMKLYDKALASGRGRPMPQPTRAKPRLHA